MAKSRKISVHSRAARRAASPSIDLDKSITSIKAPTDAVDYNPKTLGVHDGGISKKKKEKPMTRAQRLRKEKGLERADKNLDILEEKTAKSKARGRKVDDRRAAWEELNKKVTKGAQPKSAKASEAVDEGDDMDQDGDQLVKSSVFADYTHTEQEEQSDPPQQHDQPAGNVADHDIADDIL